MDRVAFRGRLDFCSNFFRRGMVLDGLTFRTREHAFQWGKFPDFRIAELIRKEPTPAKAKARAKEYRQYRWPDWEQGRSIEHMERVVWEFFKQHEDMRKLLLGTGVEHLEERNTWGDMFWGTVDGKGRNELGKCLMRVRDRLVRFA